MADNPSPPTVEPAAWKGGTELGPVALQDHGSAQGRRRRKGCGAQFGGSLRASTRFRLGLGVIALMALTVFGFFDYDT